MEPSTQTPSGPQTKEPKSPQNSSTEIPSLDSDDHAAFWSTYDKVASDHDAELLDGWNKSLDILLIFAALFSAINTAFIVESYKGLQPDQAEITNALLRLLIAHRADNVSLPHEVLHQGYADSSPLPVNSVFFASLSLSLTAAFGAVTAKQWLGEYRKTGPIRAIHKQCLARQKKFEGLETWRFHFLIELLPLLLQLSLLIFLVGIIQFIWALERRIAVMELVFTAVGLALYMTTIIIAMICPTSPFQTPLSKYLLQVLVWMLHVGQGVGQRIGSLAPMLSITYPFQCLGSRWRNLLGVVNGYYAHLLHKGHQPIARSSTGWSLRDELVAGTVVWLLEHSEHTDITIAALDATLRLPGDLVLALINRREGLRERLVMFHLNQTSLALNASSQELRDRAVLTQMVLFHIFKLDTSSDYHPDLLPNHHIPIRIEIGERGGHHGFEQLEHTTTESVPNAVIKWSQAALINPDCEMLLRLTTLTFSINMAKHHSGANSFVSSVVPAHLALEALICSILLGHMPPISISSSEGAKWRDIAEGLKSLLDAKLSWSTISHVALAVVAMHCITPEEGRAKRLCYTTTEQQTDLEHLLKRSIYAPDKSKMVLHNLALALSLVDPYSLDLLFEILYRLLSLAEGELCNILANHDGSCRSLYPHLPESLLRLSRKIPRNRADRDIILRILGNYGGWISSSTVEYAEEIIQLYRTEFSAIPNRPPVSITSPPNKTPLYRLTADIVITWEVQLFRDVFLSEQGVIAHSDDLPSWVAIQPVYSAILDSVPFKYSRSTAYIQECQLDLALKWLTRLYASPFQGSEGDHQGIGSLTAFLKKVLHDDFQLKWPSYYPQDFNDTMDSEGQHQSLMNYLKYHHLVHVWIGDMTLMLWKAACDAHADLWISSEWSDSAFFECAVVELMLYHEDHLEMQSFEGVDRHTLTDYFNRALGSQSVQTISDIPDKDRNRRSSPTRGSRYGEHGAIYDQHEVSQKEEKRMTGTPSTKEHIDLHARIRRTLARLGSYT
ncbi:hypothetical protein FRC02_008202 [Tulasnella sp. 418]|nr:hypothetical protein FRC02_008202 [Tulasnella sp. 418]